MTTAVRACVCLALISASEPGGQPPCNELSRCVSRYGKPQMHASDVRRWLDVGMAECFAQRNPGYLEEQGACLPLTLGNDARNGQSIELHYTCSDVCPAYGGIVTRYAGVAEPDCCAAGGLPRHDPAWGGYLGCTPPDVQLPRFNMRKVDGGPMELAFRNPCDGNYHFEDGTVLPGPQRQAAPQPRKTFEGPRPR